MDKEKQQFVKYEFWIKSSRGTNETEIINIPRKYASDKNYLKTKLEDWCDKFGAMHVSENVVHYGFRPYKLKK
jgi:hypothetical protein